MDTSNRDTADHDKGQRDLRAEYIFWPKNKDRRRVMLEFRTAVDSETAKMMARRWVKENRDVSPIRDRLEIR